MTNPPAGGLNAAECPPDAGRRTHEPDAGRMSHESGRMSHESGRMPREWTHDA